MYMMSPGGHRWRTAVIAGNHIDFNKSNYEMTDVFDVIMKAVR